MKADKKLIMHGTPLINSETGKTIGMRYFPTRTACKEFAVARMKAAGRKGWSMDSIPAEVVAELLELHVPIPEHRT